MSDEDLSSFSMDELFRAEADGQCESLSDDLLALERTSDPAPLLERLMRAAHSLKGAARIVGQDQAVRVAHVMEERFVQAQAKNSVPSPGEVDVLLMGVDLLKQLSGVTEGGADQAQIEKFLILCVSAKFEVKATPVPQVTPSVNAPASLPVVEVREEAAPEVLVRERRDLRLDSERLDTLLGLASQALVTSKNEKQQMSPVPGGLRRLHMLLLTLSKAESETRRAALIREASEVVTDCQAHYADEDEQDAHQLRQVSQLCGRIYTEALACRQRPFGDIVSGIRRLVRDLARDLSKDVQIEVSGEETEVDRDLLDRLDGPLSHLIRNALDHGLETPWEREAAGKSPTGSLRVSARHQGGWLVVTVEDNGRGLNPQAIKEAVLRRGLSGPEQVALMSETELTDFLLLPGFSLSKTVTEISGRGVGLDAVRAMAYGAGGSLRILNNDEGGFLCDIILPVSLSLVRALVVVIARDFFAFPLTRVERVLRAQREDIQAVGGRQHLFLEQERVEILHAGEVMGLGASEAAKQSFLVVILQGGQGRIGLVVDDLVGMRELSLQRLDARLGKLQDVSAVALLDNGEPVVVVDINDLAITAANFSSGSRYQPVMTNHRSANVKVRKVLVVDDSLTVRELERKLLASRGYAVDTAVDGADGWNALRAGAYDLLITDIDMPRLDGIELTRLVRSDVKLRDLPVIVVSYKDRQEDRARGLEAGADFYLPKSSYQDESLLNAVFDLIGDSIVL